ncbi:MAG: alcohol dehydrogenase catalytic domain-containing protein [bacterium]
MLAAHIGDKLEITKAPRPAISKNEALIRVHCTGICNTDIELLKGYMGFIGIPGHEFVGTVEECADKDWLGKRVVGEINLACEQCDYCSHSLQRHCPNRSVLGILNKDGAMAEYVSLPIQNLHIVPESIPDHKAVFTEPLAAACEIAEQVHLRPGMSTLVIGDGKLGLLIVQVLKKYGCDAWLLGRHRNKLNLAENWGVKTTDQPEKLLNKFDLIVEATGAGKAFALAAEKVRPRGILALKSTYAGSVELNLAPLVINEITLVGSRCGQFKPALKMLANGEIDTESLITDRMPLEQAIEAFRLAQKPSVLKVLLEM